MNGFSRKSICFVVSILTTMLLISAAQAQESPRWVGAFYVQGKVGLKWKKVEGAKEYTIYRATEGNKPEKLITTEKTQYFDLQLTPGSVYVYKIGSKGADGKEVFSSEKRVSIPGGGEFSPPIWTGLRIDRDKVLMRWDRLTGAMAYNVYRSEISGSGYEVVGNATSTRYADEDGLERGKTYYYVLTALDDQFEETEFSEERSIQFGQSDAEIKAALKAAEAVHLEDTKLTFLFEITSAGNLGKLNQPADVYLNSKGDIYVTDALNQRVNCYDADGKYRFSFGEKTPGGSEADAPEGSFSLPFTLFIDKSDNVYVTDVINSDIQVFSPNGDFKRRITVATEAGMKDFHPNGIHVLDDGRIVATDAENSRFLILDQDGKILLSKGQMGGEEGAFNFTDEIVVTANNTICVIDIFNCRVQEFDLEGNFIRAFGGVGRSAGMFGRPKGIALDDKGQLWVSDGMGNTVQIFTVEGEVKSAITSFEKEGLQLGSPRGMFIRDGKFYVVNRLFNQVLVFKIG